MALEWLKPILGDTYTEELDGKISAELGKHFVSREDFNTTNTAKKALEQDVANRDKQLDDLKASTGDVEDLKKQIAALQEQNKTDKEAHEAELNQLRMDNAVEAALTAAGAKNNKAVKALLTEFLADAKLTDDGKVKGLDAEIASMAKAEETAFLFAVADNKAAPQFKGMTPGNPGGNVAPAEGGKTPKDMSYSELCEYLAANPDAKL